MSGTAVEHLTNKQHDIFIEYYKSIVDTQHEIRNTLRASMLKVDKEYQRENDETVAHKRALQANRRGDTTKFQNVVVPVVKPQVEIASAYQASVFLTGVPLFGVVHNPEFIDEALQMETVIDEQARLGGWVRELMLSFRDGYKYNFAPIEVDWGQEISYEVETDLATNKTEGVPKKVIWKGNKLMRLDPYNTIVDQTVTPSECYRKGDFSGYTQLMSRMGLKQFLAELPNKQTRVTKAFEASSSVAVSSNIETAYYYIPKVNPDQELLQIGAEGTNWMKWAGLAANDTPIDYKDHYHVTTLYARILPGEFDLRVPNKFTPQIWKLIIVNHSVIVYSERQTNAHNWLPILIGQPSEDGLGYQTKSLATDAEPFQQSASAFMNSIIASRRRAITDRLLYDPSRVSSAVINSSSSSAKMPVRPAAYGKPVSEAVHQFPYREDQNSMAMAQVADLLDMANGLNGQNPARQGQFVKGNKTREEFNQIMDNSVSRDVMASLLYEDQIFTPMKHILKINILQFQGQATLTSTEKERSVNIDPVALRKAALSFRVSDGLVPSSKIISSENFSVALQTIATSPQIGAGYNISPMFSYLMKTKGADLRPFEKPPEQLAYEQAMQQWTALAQAMIEKSEAGQLPDNFPPQPLPEQFGYNPNPEASTQGQSVANPEQDDGNTTN